MSAVSTSCPTFRCRAQRSGRCPSRHVRSWAASTSLLSSSTPPRSSLSPRRSRGWGCPSPRCPGRRRPRPCTRMILALQVPVALARRGRHTVARSCAGSSEHFCPTTRRLVPLCLHLCDLGRHRLHRDRCSCRSKLVLDEWLDQPWVFGGCGGEACSIPSAPWACFAGDGDSMINRAGDGDGDAGEIAPPSSCWSSKMVCTA